MAVIDRRGVTVGVAPPPPQQSEPTPSLGFKTPVRAATVADLPDLSGLLTIDTVTLQEGDRVLVKNQIIPSWNGIYNASVGAWSRTVDFDNERETVRGMQVVVNEGVQAKSIWVLVSPDPIVPDTTSIAFDRLGATSGSEFDNKAAVQAASIAVVQLALRTNGYYTAGDLGGALFKRVGAEPGHIGKIQSGDGAWWEIVERSFDVRMFGAKGDGVADDTSSIQGALDARAALPGGNRRVRLSGGTYRITQTINIGNGALNTASTINSLGLVGAGIPGYNDLSFNGPTILSWDGGTNGTMISIKGPMRGWEVSKLLLDGHSIAGVVGLSCVSGSNWKSEFLTFTNIFRSAVFTCRDGSPSSNSMMGVAENWVIQMPDLANTYGLILDGSPTVPASTYLNQFTNLQIFPPPTAVSTALYLRVVDTVTFKHLLVFASTANPNARGVVFDYTSGNAYFPASCVFDTPDVGWGILPANQWIHNGGSGLGTPNRIISFSGLNGGVMPDPHPNLLVTDGQIIPGFAGAIPWYSDTGYVLRGHTNWSFSSGALVGTSTTDSSSTGTGAFRTAGGIGVAKNIWCGQTVVASSFRVNGTVGQDTLGAGGNYTFVNSQSTTGASMQFGNNADPSFYINGDNGHNFRNNNGTVVYASITSARMTMGVPIKLKSFTFATLPAGQLGDLAHASNVRALVGSTGAANLTLQGAGAGTGSPVWHNGTSWQLPGIAAAAAA